MTVPTTTSSRPAEGDSAHTNPGLRRALLTSSVGSALVMPFSDALDVTAVVANAGNVVAEEITVELRLEGEDVDPFVEQRIIPSLAPGTAETIEVPGIPLQPDTLYTLTVAASIENESSPDDNLWQVVFATNPE